MRPSSVKVVAATLSLCCCIIVAIIVGHSIIDSIEQSYTVALTLRYNDEPKLVHKLRCLCFEPGGTVVETAIAGHREQDEGILRWEKRSSGYIKLYLSLIHI